MWLVFGHRAHVCWRCALGGIHVDWNFVKVKLTTVLVMRLAIDVASRHAENAINSCITYNKSNNACGMTDDQSNCPTTDISYSLIIMKKFKINKSHWNRQKWCLDEYVSFNWIKKAIRFLLFSSSFSFSISFIEMDDKHKQSLFEFYSFSFNHFLCFEKNLNLKDCLICILNAKTFTHFKFKHSFLFASLTFEPKQCNNDIHKNNDKMYNSVNLYASKSVKVTKK